MAESKEPQKKLFFTERISRIVDEMKTYTKTDRLQYRTDAKALICRGIEDQEIQKIQNGLKVEQGMFYVSRAYVPFALFRLYRAGQFEQSFSFGEFKHIVKIAITMQLLDLFGHFLLRQITRPTMDKYIALNEMEFASKKKKMLDDYMIQKQYLREKKDAKLFKNF